jgi:glutathione S-transferase
MIEIIDSQLANSFDYIVSNEFTLADIPIGLSIHRWISMPMARPALINVERYYERLCQRSGFQLYGRDGGA